MPPAGATRTAAAFAEKLHKPVTTLRSLITCTAQPKPAKLAYTTLQIYQRTYNFTLRQ